MELTIKETPKPTGSFWEITRINRDRGYVRLEKLSTREKCYRAILGLGSPALAVRLSYKVFTSASRADDHKRRVEDRLSRGAFPPPARE